MGIPKKITNVLAKHHMTLLELCEILNELGIASDEELKKVRRHPAARRFDWVKSAMASR